MFRIATLGAIMMGAVACMSPSMAQQTTPPPPCSTEEYRQMDFWVGHWDAKWEDADGTEQHGTYTISHQLDGCMVFEEFNGNPGNTLLGRSMSEFLARASAWKQVWMDNTGGYFALTGGMVGEDFILNMDRPVETAPYLRMVYTNISHERFDWHWQNSTDAGETWNDQWVINYTRIE